MRKELRNRLIIIVGSILFRLWFSTCRLTIIGREYHDRYAMGNGPAVGATWHRCAIFLVWFFRRIKPMIMFSRSADGDLLAGFAEKVGVRPVRGSSSRGGREALRTMHDFLSRPGRHKAATVLDGPRGPRFVAKKGMIVLAKEAGAPLLPIMMSAWPAVTIKNAWDRTLVPLPFSRVTVVYREPWRIPPKLDEQGMEALRVEVEETLNDMMQEADMDTGYIRQWPAVYNKRQP